MFQLDLALVLLRENHSSPIHPPLQERGGSLHPKRLSPLEQLDHLSPPLHPQNPRGLRAPCC